MNSYTKKTIWRTFVAVCGIVLIVVGTYNIVGMNKITNETKPSGWYQSGFADGMNWVSYAAIILGAGATVLAISALIIYRRPAQPRLRSHREVDVSHIDPFTRHGAEGGSL